VLFVCENNGYSTHTPLEIRQPASVSIRSRAASYGMPSVRVDGNDVFAVFAAAQGAVDQSRQGHGPSFMECMTYRWREHVGPMWDYDKGYRAKAEVDEWIARCPIKRASERLIAEGVCSVDDVERFGRDSQAEVNRAVAAAKAAPFPAVEDLTVGTY